MTSSRTSALASLPDAAAVGETSLDPADWSAYRDLAHRMLDEAIESLRGKADGPVWQPVPAEVLHQLDEPLPLDPQGTEKAAGDAARLILPYPVGNTHPRFFGWVHGSGTAGGIIAETLAAAMNVNAGGRDHAAIHVERQVIGWLRQHFGMPETASGLIVSGTSIATLIALTVARNAVLGKDARRLGLAASAAPLVAYTSSEAHSSVARALEMLGVGNAALTSIAADADFRLVPEDLRRAIRADKAAGRKPFAVIATAGTVATGAIDPLAAIADVCAGEGVWLHVDGAFGALAMLSDTLRPQLAGIQRADSLAFDFHKWMHVQYDAGCVLVRDGSLQREAFASRPTYLAGHARGLAAGEPWPCDLGPELSRSFRALKVWFTLKEHGTRRIAASIEDNCRLARLLGERVMAEPRLELLAPVSLNIACFRLRTPGLTAAEQDRLNEDTVAELQVRGIAAPSTTRIGGKLAIRVNITNHRTREADIGILLDGVLAIGTELLEARSAPAALPETPGSGEGSTRVPFDCLVRLDAALSRPEIGITAAGLAFSIAPGLGMPVRLTPSLGVALSPSVLSTVEAAAVLIRHGAEMAVWHRTCGHAPELRAATALLAGRCAGLYLAGLNERERAQAEAGLPSWLLQAYRTLAAPLTHADFAGLMGRQADTLARLLALTGATSTECARLAASTSLRIEAVNAFARLIEMAAPAEHLLTQGGDSRIRPDARTGRNGYGSSTRPVPDEIAFSSSTASNVSASAYASVETLRRRLVAAAAEGRSAEALPAEVERIRAGVARHSGCASVEGASVVLTASGTDAELATVAFALAADERPVTSIVLSPEETGSGVPQATLGQSFSSETALGHKAKSGQPITGLAEGRIDSVSIAIRDAEGFPRPAFYNESEVSAAIAAAAAAGRRVLLHILDSAKTGIGAPRLEVVRELQMRHGNALDIVVDACQARLAPDSIAAYLQQGWLVQITGSKLWGGPPFSGALLVPRELLERAPRLDRPLAALGGYMARCEWPAELSGPAAALPDRHNLGLLARWQAALSEVEPLTILGATRCAELLADFEWLAVEALTQVPELAPVEGAPLDRSAFAPDPWGRARSIVPFTMTRPSGASLSLDDAKLVHRLLASDLGDRLPGLSDEERRLASTRCHLGQPVKLGRTGALRICASARVLLQLNESEGVARTSRDLAATLAKTRLVLRHLDCLKSVA